MLMMKWKLTFMTFMAYMILDINWHFRHFFTHTLTFVKIFSTLGAPKVVRFSSTPRFFTEEERPKDLECIFSGWPLEVHWYKNDEIITNGTKGIYHSVDKRRKEGEETLHSRLSLPQGREELEGSYKCSAENSFSEASQSLQLIYVCK